MKEHVLLAGLLDPAAGDQAPAVGQQHNLEHDPGVVGAGAGRVVVEPGVECTQVEFVVDQVVQRKLERPGLNLLLQHNRDEHPAALDRLVACHLDSHINAMCVLCKSCASNSPPRSKLGLGWLLHSLNVFDTSCVPRRTGSGGAIEAIPNQCQERYEDGNEKPSRDNDTAGQMTASIGKQRLATTIGTSQ